MALLFKNSSLHDLSSSASTGAQRQRRVRHGRPQRAVTTAAAAAAQEQHAPPPAHKATQAPSQLHRRSLLAATAIITAAATAPLAARAAAADGAPASSITIEADAPGTAGTAAARKNDLVLIHYTGTVAATGEVFDTTLGLGLTYRDGGPGTLRPLALRLSGDPIPGVCAGLQQALLGMTAGGARTVLIPPELGFGGAPAAAPYGVIPGGSALRYEIQLLRLSRRGPDALFAGMSKCSQGGASAVVDNCANIEPAEFV